MNGLTDSHTHLHSCCTSYPENCVALVNAASQNEWAGISQLSHNYPGRIIPFYGIHPWFIHPVSEYWLEELELIIKKNPRSGIGEIGLDRLKSRQDPGRYSIEEQHELFTWQLHLALKHQRPFSIHCVKAWDLLMEALKNARALYPAANKGLIHYFHGSLQIMEELLDYGFFISFHPSIHDGPNKKLRNIFSSCPKDRLLLETDLELTCNNGCLVEHYTKSAALLNMTTETLIKITQKNTALFTGFSINCINGYKIKGD